MAYSVWGLRISVFGLRICTYAAIHIEIVMLHNEFATMLSVVTADRECDQVTVRSICSNQGGSSALFCPITMGSSTPPLNYTTP